MEEYFTLSTASCQSRDQQEINSRLVIEARAAARKRGWSFNPTVRRQEDPLPDPVLLQDTHQNAKKRLKTMVRNPTKLASTKALAGHLDRIEKYNREEAMKGSHQLLDNRKPKMCDLASEPKKVVPKVHLSGSSSCSAGSGSDSDSGSDQSDDSIAADGPQRGREEQKLDHCAWPPPRRRRSRHAAAPD